MRNRIPTRVLGNGAIRYAVYDEQGDFLRYEYMLPADEPIDEGTPLNKANLLSDSTAAAIFGSTGDPTVNDALANLGTKAQNLQSGINQLSTAKGNCEIYTGSYAGNGADQTLVFPKPINLISIHTMTTTADYFGGTMPVWSGMETSLLHGFTGDATCKITASADRKIIVIGGDYGYLNKLQRTYQYTALAAAT